MKAILLLFFFMFFIACEKRDKKTSSEKKPPSCPEKLKGFHICLLSQFYSLPCEKLTEQESIEIQDFCKEPNITPALEKECPQKIKEFYKTISEEKFNKCKKKAEVKQQ